MGGDPGGHDSEFLAWGDGILSVAGEYELCEATEALSSSVRVRTWTRLYPGVFAVGPKYLYHKG